MKINILLKWITAALLALSIAFFFLPYLPDYTPIEIIKEANQIGRSNIVTEVILQWVVPVGFMLLAALMMALRNSKAKCVLAALFCLIAVTFHFMGINSGYFSNEMEIGRTLNLILSIVGVILPIIVFVMTPKKVKTNETNAK